MYFPYLRGRQFELFALREFAIHRGDRNNVFPIIEPVKKSLNSLKIAIKVFKETNLPFALIMNPRVGELQGNIELFVELKEELEGSKWIPAFTVTNNIDILNNYIQDKGFTELMVILTSSANPDAENFIPFISDEKVKYIVANEVRLLKRSLRGTPKNYIVLKDCFKRLERNRDYLASVEERFTDENIFYRAEDNNYGFADFTTISSDFIEGGTTPYAVVIHITYQKESEEIWIKHFTSVSNEDQANVQGKFAEAAEKAVRFLDEKNIRTNASNELREYFEAQKYPGLGMVKKISIKHHIELINSIL
jgi:hypothetical protein